MKKWYMIKTCKFCCAVQTEHNIIISSAPILKKFIGQNFHNLTVWINRNFEEYTIEEIC